MIMEVRSFDPLFNRLGIHGPNDSPHRFLGFGYDPRAVPPHMPHGYPPRFNPHHHYFHQEQGQGVFYHPRQPSFQYHGQQGNQNQQQYGQNNHGRFQSPNNAPGKFNK